MDFYVMEVSRMITVNGKNVRFSYANTYFDRHKAIEDAEKLSEDKRVMKVCVFHGVVRENGSRYTIEEDIPYCYINERRS